MSPVQSPAVLHNQFSFAVSPPPLLRQVSLGSPLAGLRLTAACLCLVNAEVTVCTPTSNSYFLF